MHHGGHHRIKKTSSHQLSYLPDLLAFFMFSDMFYAISGFLL